MTVKQSNLYMTKNTKQKKRLNDQRNYMLMKNNISYWAKEAHKIDSSKPVSYYYEILIGRLDGIYFTDEEKERFFDGLAIDN